MDLIGRAFAALRSYVDDDETLARHLRRERLMVKSDVAATDCVVEVAPNHEATPLDVVRERQLVSALASFHADIEEPRGNNWESIDVRIRGADGLGWSWEDRYVRNGQFAWCGAEAALHLGAAGLSSTIRSKVMPSCYRLAKFCQVDDPTQQRVVSTLADALPGDIVVVGASDSKWYGAHITTLLQVDLDGGRVYLHEGNAKAYGPDGSYREGVGRRWRDIDRRRPSDYVPMHIYRFLETDFVPVDD